MSSRKKKAVLRDDDDIAEIYLPVKKVIEDQYTDGSVPYTSESIDFNKDTWFTIKSSDGEMGYKKSRENDNVHWGQLKLFISELQFILYLMNEKIDTILYVGGAPGHHIVVLAEMFPTITFHLYDIRDVFDERFKTMKNVKTTSHPDGFIQAHIDEWKKKKAKFAFMSDIRDLEYGKGVAKKSDISEMNKIVDEDLELQKNWILELKPYISMLKFRTEWLMQEDYEKTFKYFDGFIMRQVFAGPNSSETRLIIFDYKKTRDWPVTVFERKLSYFNNVTRDKQKFTTTVIKRLGIKDNFDCATFVTVVRDYLGSIEIEDNETNLEIMLDYILNNIHPEAGNKLRSL